MKKKAIFFDRDGVLNRTIIVNRKPKAPKKLEEFKLYKNLEKGFQKLKKKNFLIYVVTNQPDFERNDKTIKKMHSVLKKSFPIQKIYCCFNKKNSSEYKKPNIGMVKNLIKEKKINLSQSYVVGDRWRDIDFAHNLNCKSIFIDRKYNEKLNKKPNYICISTSQAINIILKNEKN